MGYSLEYVLNLKNNVRKLTQQNRQLQIQVDELSKRPELFILDKLQPGLSSQIRGSRSIIASELKPGMKYKLVLIPHHSHMNIKYIFETPMMLVETPNMIVITENVHTNMHDDLIAVNMKGKRND